MTSRGSRLSRGKKERFLRYVLRRKPCGYILLGNIVALVLFIAGLVGLFLTAKHFTNKNRLYDKEEATMKQYYADTITFGHCQYKSMNPTWQTERCDKFCGQAAFIYRTFELDTYREYNKSCIDRMDISLCHEDFKRACVEPRLKDIKSCSGFAGVPMSSILVKKDTEKNAALVNSISNDDKGANDLRGYVNQTLLANELVIRCPVCNVVSTPFYVKGSHDDGTKTCFRVLETVNEGWPSHGQFCDNLDEVTNKRPDDEFGANKSQSRKKLASDNPKVIKRAMSRSGPKEKPEGVDEPCIGISM